jgi:hypothetical protein
MSYTVECYSGARYGERPTALVSEQTRLEVSEILKSWRSPTGIIFQVLTEDGQSFELIFEEKFARWSVEAI